MGDRANIEVRDGDESVFLYTHWSGSEAPEILRRALDRGEERWSDSSYLARIIFCEMVKGHEMELTGFGISATEISATEISANKHITVDVPNKSVSIDDYAPIHFKDYVASLRMRESTTETADA
jgi:hypothetical protein